MHANPASLTHDEVDATLRRFEATQSEMDWAIGEWLIAADELKVHIHFGCANFCEYVGRIFGWNWRQALQRLDTAKQLRELPEARSSSQRPAPLVCGARSRARRHSRQRSRLAAAHRGVAMLRKSASESVANMRTPFW